MNNQNVDAIVYLILQDLKKWKDNPEDKYTLLTSIIATIQDNKSIVYSMTPGQQAAFLTDQLHNMYNEWKDSLWKKTL